MILAAPSVLLPDGSAERGFVEVTDSTITGVSAHAPTPVASQDAVDPTVAPEQVDLEALGITHLAPGFVDIHNHGGGERPSPRAPWPRPEPSRCTARTGPPR
ncbi:hypothetical protein [Arsenicicoccus piscis]|uniref:Amidohydrolase 3 domain-containing protein n=1 Tax=Arsenicicoccus piscis TaxID=673954 RepID=A0ABQ6HK08_9MICO|nr:hypothetical protein [Arsenicicoccus piscis]GMA18502.1 hypothetical protein GCM10025862_05230 [Arsenicicoccus piscis]